MDQRQSDFYVVSPKMSIILYKCFREISHHEILSSNNSVRDLISRSVKIFFIVAPLKPVIHILCGTNFCVLVAQTKRMTTKLQLPSRFNAASLATNLTTTTTYNTISNGIILNSVRSLHDQVARVNNYSKPAT